MQISEQVAEDRKVASPWGRRMWTKTRVSRVLAKKVTLVEPGDHPLPGGPRAIYPPVTEARGGCGIAAFDFLLHSLIRILNQQGVFEP